MVKLSYFTGIILLVRLLILLPTVLRTTDTPGAYVLHVIIYLLFFTLSFFFQFQYVINKYNKTLTITEFSMVVMQCISTIIMLLATTIHITTFLATLPYLAIILITLGGVEYYRHRHPICLSFPFWGGFIFVWFQSIYYSQHLSSAPF